MCLYFSLVDFDFKEKLEEIYNGFEKLLIKSDIVKNKELPYIDFLYYINCFDHLLHSKIKLRNSVSSRNKNKEEN